MATSPSPSKDTKESFLEKYRWQLIAGGSACCLCVILILFFMMRRSDY